ncbi:hypothetical protein [Piscinibacter defluvii]|uniref:hypothetical protein n=1 Tax=Piscinibacter defluvii TaxID=1796922 RepID=UPI000FDE7195|nr:hypothetical protein [Piscinibacter defluvii]
MNRRAVGGALRQRAPASILAGAAIWLGAGVVHAEVIDLQWQDGNRFERSLTVAPGKFAEICGSLDAGQTVNWAFEADRAVNFNVHYHVDKEVRYPAKKDQVKQLTGDLSVDAKQDYCWMWVNKTTSTAKLSVTLMRK